jgi:hypothetical protein
MEAIFIASYAIIGFFFGVIIGFTKILLMFVIKKLSLKGPFIKNAFISLLLFFVSFNLFISECSAGGGWLIYHERSFKGKVIDAETKEPVEGAIVVAQYHVNMLGPTGSHTTFIDVQEALTDKDGEFFIPSLTKIINPLSVGYDTRFLIWKPGYKPEEMLRGDFFSKAPGTIEDRVVYTDKGMELKPTRIGIMELVKVKTKEGRRMVTPSIRGEKSDWKKQQQFIRLLREEWKYIYSEEPPEDLYKIEE